MKPFLKKCKLGINELDENRETGIAEVSHKLNIKGIIRPVLSYRVTILKQTRKE